MKNLLYLFVTLLITSCSPSLKATKEKCLDLSDLANGKVTFEVNEGTDKAKPKESYPRNYLIEVYEDHARTNLLSNLLLYRKANFALTITLDPAKKKEYCILIHKDRLLAGYQLMEWEKMNNGQAGIIKKENTYYASTSNFFVPLITKITSKDGAGGDGVKAVID